MKAIGIYNMSAPGQGREKLVVWPDSSVINTGKPLFTPFAPTVLFFAPGVRIDRLGKSILPKFASRYYREMTIFCIVAGEETAAGFREGNDIASGSIAYDYSVVTGTFKPLDTLELSVDISGRIIDFQGKEIYKFTLPLADFENDMPSAVSLASRGMTLKTGDLLFVIHPDSGVMVNPDSIVELRMNDTEILKFKVK